MAEPADLDAAKTAWQQDRLALVAEMEGHKQTKAQLAATAAALKACQDAAAPVPTPPTFVLGQTKPQGHVGAGILRAKPTSVERGTSGFFKTPTSGIVRDKVFECFVDRSAGTFEFENCIVKGPDTYPDTLKRPLIKAWDEPIVSTVLRYCTVMHPQMLHDGITNIQGSQYTYEMCDVHHVMDGFRTQPKNGRLDVKLLGVWIHDLVWFAEAQHADGSHTDGVQNSYGGLGFYAEGCQWDGLLADDAGDPRPDRRTMSHVMLSPRATKEPYVLDMHLKNCWMDNSQVCFNFAGWGKDTPIPGGKRLIEGMTWGPGVTIGVLAPSALHPSITITGSKGGTHPNFRERVNG